MALNAEETEDLKKFQQDTNDFAVRLFEYASMLGFQYLLPHIYDLQSEIQERLNVPDTNEG